MAREKWETRWSPAEMMYLEVTDKDVIMYLDHAPTRPDRFTFEQVLSGESDRYYWNEFGEAVVKELQEAVRKRLAKT